MIGSVQTERWRTIAADIDGVPQPEKAGQVTVRRQAQFAYRAEAEQWAAEQEAEGFGGTVISSAAVAYFGPTDAPGNCWSVSTERLLEHAAAGHRDGE